MVAPLERGTHTSERISGLIFFVEISGGLCTLQPQNKTPEGWGACELSEERMEWIPE